ncbi:Pleiotropic regulator 1 [Pelomyxa schiedti]|nr:Pleiotropic regulator 1 [Pelomyxa schiedti]
MDGAVEIVSVTSDASVGGNQALLSLLKSLKRTYTLYGAMPGTYDPKSFSLSPSEATAAKTTKASDDAGERPTAAKKPEKSTRRDYSPSDAVKVRLLTKISGEYANVPAATPAAAPAQPTKKRQRKTSKASTPTETESMPVESPVTVTGPHPHPSAPGVSLTENTAVPGRQPSSAAKTAVIEDMDEAAVDASINASLSAIRQTAHEHLPSTSTSSTTPNNLALVKSYQVPLLSDIGKPEWHPPWKLYRVIAGHLGWVRSVCVDPANEWFATGSADRTIKIWDLATGQLKLTLTGHINSVRGLAVSAKHPYLFSCAEDKMVKCWDLEYNKVVRQYHGHLSGVYCLSLHPTLDLLTTGGRDSVCRVWDIRTKAQVHVLEGHNNTVSSICSQGPDPQIISGSADTTIKYWDLAEGRCITTLTHHKKGIRSMAIHHTEFTMMSGAADNLKKWRLPKGEFMTNFTGHNSVVNAIALSSDNVLVSGGDNGSLYFWDWKTGYNFQQEQTKPQPGSLESEAGIYALSFDQTSLRLITCEADKSVKLWKMDEEATPETHPVKNWRVPKDKKKF